MRHVAESHRIACRNPCIDTGVRAEIAEVCALRLHENGTLRYCYYCTEDRTALVLEHA
jgi:hypothetical protein